jgi:hypothetical protein
VAEVPVFALEGVPTSPSIVLQTTLQNMLMISDVPGPTGGIMLLIGPTPAVASLSISESGIILQSGDSVISMRPEGAIVITGGTGSIAVGPALSVTVNTDGLVVT